MELPTFGLAHKFNVYHEIFDISVIFMNMLEDDNIKSTVIGLVEGAFGVATAVMNNTSTVCEEEDDLILSKCPFIL